MPGDDELATELQPLPVKLSTSSDQKETVKAATDFISAFIHHFAVFAKGYQHIKTEFTEPFANLKNDLQELQKSNAEEKALNAIEQFIINYGPKQYSRGLLESGLIKCLNKALAGIAAKKTSLPSRLSVGMKPEQKTATTINLKTKFILRHAVTDLIAKIEIAKNDGYDVLQQRTIGSYGYQLLNLIYQNLHYSPDKTLAGKTKTFFSSFYTPTESKPRPIDNAYANLKTTVAEKNKLLNTDNYPTIEAQLTIIKEIAKAMLETLDTMYGMRPKVSTFSYENVAKCGDSEKSIRNAAKIAYNAINEMKIGVNPRDRTGLLLRVDGHNSKLLNEIAQAFYAVIHDNRSQIERGAIDLERGKVDRDFIPTL